MEKLNTCDTTGLPLPLVILLRRRKGVVGEKAAAVVVVVAAEVLRKAAEGVTCAKVSSAVKSIV